jgi:hypothetical protein
MAKKRPDMSNLFAKTEPGQAAADTSDLDAGNIQSTGVGLREGEIAALNAIGQALGDHLDAGPVARNSIMRIAIRRFLEAYRRGDITLDDLAGHFTTPDKPQPKLNL